MSINPDSNPTCSISDKPIFAHVKTFANNAITSAKQFGGKVYTNVSELAKNPMTYGVVGSSIGGAVLVGASAQAIRNRKSQGFKEQLPTLATALGGLALIGLSQIAVNNSAAALGSAVVTGLSQIAAYDSSERIILLVAAVAGGVVGGVTVAISSKKAAPAQV